MWKVSPSNMNDKMFNEWCEKRVAKKAQAREIITRYGAVRMDWTCDCGSNLKWNSDYHQEEHKKTKKHQAHIIKASGGHDEGK